ncbi:MAG TPA: LLM class flavin-dependent oxidoreductase, partial [Terriglobales bacterium]|nr:LLM class flavin-dependent oxidoreductase [Terriglobales bacterium]
YLQDKHRVREEIELCQYAEKNGFEAIWHAESRLARDALVPLAAISVVTKKIKLGTGVINNWTRNVGLTAASFLTLDELSEGRTLLGIGAWWDPLAWKVGIQRKKPLKAMREYVTVLQRLFRMENVTFEGEFVNVRDIRLDVVYGDPSTPRKIPIYIGATGWDMIGLTGELADGLLLNYLVSPDYNRKALEHLEVGVKKAGRRLENLDRPQLVVCSLDDDADRALDSARSLVAQYLGQQPHIARASGVKESLIEEVKTALGGWPAKPGGLEKAKALVDDKLVQLITASGTTQDCIRKVEEYNSTGCTCPVLYPLGDDVHAMIDAFAAEKT